MWRMAEVLDLYEDPYDPKRPMICFDEQPYQMLSDVKDPLPMKPGRPERVNFEYEREGNAYVHMAFEPLKGFREVEVTENAVGAWSSLRQRTSTNGLPACRLVRL